MDKKKQGSAMVLAVLMLAFFMTLSLNMYFLADNKAQRAKARSELSGVVGDIDFSSTLGYYEIYLASEYITDGFLTSPDTATTKVGIAIPSYIEYFSSVVNGIMEHTAGSFVTASAIFSSTSAIESIDISKFGELWYNTGRSIGGYSLVEIKKADTTTSPAFATTSDFISAVFPVEAVGEETSITTLYTKGISFPADGTLKIEGTDFEIRTERTTGLRYDTISEYAIISDRIKSIEVINKGNN